MTTEGNGLVFATGDLGQVGHDFVILSLAKSTGMYVFLCSLSIGSREWVDFGILGSDGGSIYVKGRMRHTTQHSEIRYKRVGRPL